MSSSTALVRANSQRAGTAGTVRSSAPPAQVLTCNRCVKPIATTCYHCRCDCIFCEECTFAHFAENSACPTCGRTLGEQDFTELVVADANASQTDIAKTSMQALFSNRSATGNLPFGVLCQSLCRQIETLRQSTKFLLKQLIVDATLQGRKGVAMARANDQHKNEITRIRQQASTQRLQHEQALADLSNRLRARESANTDLQKKLSEKERMIEQFRRIHNGMVPSTSGGGSGGTGQVVPPSTGQGRIGAERMGGIGGGRGSMPGGGQQQQEPGPLKGFMRNQAVSKSAQQQAMHARPTPLGLLSSSHGGANAQGQVFRRSNSLGNHSGGHHHPYARPQHQQQPGTSLLGRPFSSNSTGSGSLPATPRIRELSSSAGYNFTSTAGGGPQRSRQNRRRTGSTPPPPSSAGVASMLQAMSPRTSNYLNNGPSSVDSRWGQRR